MANNFFAKKSMDELIALAGCLILISAGVIMFFTGRINKSRAINIK